MSKKKMLIIFGNGGLSSVVRFYCENAGIKIASFTVDESYLNRVTFEGLPNVGFDGLTKKFLPNEHMLFIAIGASDMLGFARQEKMYEGSSMGYKLFSGALVDSSLKEKILLGKNSLIMPGCNVDPFVNFGDGVIVWNGATICHDTNVGNYSFIAPGATICGRVSVSDHCFIGSNATIRDNIIIAPKCIVGAGAIINHDTTKEGVYMPGRTAKLQYLSSEFMSQKSENL